MERLPNPPLRRESAGSGLLEWRFGDSYPSKPEPWATNARPTSVTIATTICCR